MAVARRYACGAPTSLGPAWELSARRLCGEHKTAASDARILWGHGSSGPRPQTKVDRPLWWGNHLGEVRWQLDAARLLVHPVLRGRGVPRGQRSPGPPPARFLAGDYTLAPMALWLRRIGYRPARAGFLTNTGCSQETLERLESRAQALADETGRRVGLIGQPWRPPEQSWRCAAPIWSPT